MLQHFVTGLVAVFIIDLLEVVNIKHHQRTGATAAAATVKFVLQGIFPGAAVQQAS